MRFDVITVFPQMIEEALRWGVVGRALRRDSSGAGGESSGFYS